MNDQRPDAEQEHQHIRRIKLMADYSAFPLWAEPSGDSDDSWCGMLEPEQLPLSPSLVDQLRRWAGDHDRFLGPELEWPSEETGQTWVEQGRRLIPLLQAELGSQYEVVYFADIQIPWHGHCPHCGHEWSDHVPPEPCNECQYAISWQRSDALAVACTSGPPVPDA